MSAIGQVIQVVNARGCDNLVEGTMFTVRGEDSTCYIIYNPKVKSLRRYAKHRFRTTGQRYHLKEQDPVRVPGLKSVLRVVAVLPGKLVVKHLFEPLGQGKSWYVPPHRAELVDSRPGTFLAFYYSEAFGKDKLFPRKQVHDYFGREFTLPVPLLDSAREWSTEENPDIIHYKTANALFTSRFLEHQSTIPRLDEARQRNVPVQAEASVLHRKAAEVAAQLQAINGSYTICGKPRDIRIMVKLRDDEEPSTVNISGARLPTVNGRNVTITLDSHERAVELARLFTSEAELPTTLDGWRAQVAGIFRYRGEPNGLNAHRVVLTAVSDVAHENSQVIFTVLEGDRKGQVIMRGVSGKSELRPSLDIIHV